MADFFVEFEITNNDRYRQLVTVVDALRSSKVSDDWRDDEYWLSFFDDAARSHFWWPTPAERDDWSRRWFSTPVPQRFSDPSLVTPWDFASMIDAIRNGDYELIGCTQIGSNMARLEFEPFGHPYGGSGCMKALIESFGFRVVAEPVA